MKKIAQLLFFLGISCLFIYSCSSDFKGYSKDESGAYYKFYIKNDCTKVKEGDKITFSLLYKINDSLIFRTNNQLSSTIVLPKSTYTGDIYDCFKLMSAGDSASFIIEADSFFIITAKRKNLPPDVKPKSKLYAYINITDVVTKEIIDSEKEKFLNECKASEIEVSKIIKAEQNFNKEFIENTGIFYNEEISGSGKLPNLTDYLLLNYEVKTADDNILFDTKELNKPKAFEYGSKEEETDGFNMIIGKMKKGQKARFFVPSNLGLGERDLRGRLKPYSPLIYTIEVIDIQTKEDYIAMQKLIETTSTNKEYDEISAYIKNNNITTVPQKSGLYYIETKEGSGSFVKKGEKVKVHYTLYNLYGKKIDSSHDRGITYDFIVGQGQVIDGWDEALTLMKKGGKASLIIPSKIAYGDKKWSEDILPYTPLLFEVELVDIVE